MTAITKGRASVVSAALLGVIGSGIMAAAGFLVMPWVSTIGPTISRRDIALAGVAVPSATRSFQQLGLVALVLALGVIVTAAIVRNRSVARAGGAGVVLVFGWSVMAYLKLVDGAGAVRPSPAVGFWAMWGGCAAAAACSFVPSTTVKSNRHLWPSTQDDGPALDTSPHLSADLRQDPPAGFGSGVVPRPVLGVLRFDTGLDVYLDRPAIIGRNPKADSASSTEAPQVIKLDVGNGLSRSHVAIHLQGWQILVEDLGSANGTDVVLESGVIQQLIAGQRVALEIGSRIDLGGEVTCVLLVA